MSDPRYDMIGTCEDKLIEEIGEVLMAISKANRFGYWNHHPERTASTNMDELRYELDDLEKRMNEYRSMLEGMQRLHEIEISCQ